MNLNAIVIQVVKSKVGLKMLEIYRPEIDPGQGKSLHGQLTQLRQLVESSTDLTENVALRGRVELDSETSLDVCVSPINNGVTGQPVYIRVGEDLSDPELSEWLMVEKNGTVSRNDVRQQAFYPLDSPEDVALFGVVIEKFKKQFEA